jgi:hypothetical protein
VLRDEITGRMWAQDNGLVYSWGPAQSTTNEISYCAGLEFGGYSSGLLLDVKSCSLGRVIAMDETLDDAMNFGKNPFLSSSGL